MISKREQERRRGGEEKKLKTDPWLTVFDSPDILIYCTLLEDGPLGALAQYSIHNVAG